MSTPLANSRPMAWPSVTAPMDVKSQPDRVAWGRWRSVTNVRAVEINRAMRREGWKLFGSETEHPNCDLYDQHGVGERLTSLYLHKTIRRGNSGNRFYAASQTAIWRNRTDGGWQNVLIGASPDTDWSFTSQNDLVVAANGKTMFYQRASDSSFSAIPSLALIGVAGAAVVWTYENCVFAADLFMDNTRVSNRVIWSHINSLNFEPSTDTIAGFKDLDPGCQILGAYPTGSTVVLITTHGAWRLGVADGQFAFQRLYFSKIRDACAVSRNAIASNRDIVFFVAADGIYAISSYSQAPEFVEWASAGLSRDWTKDSRCRINASGYDPTRNEIYFSSREMGMTYAINTRTTSTSLIDAAFDAILYADIDRSMDVSQWWVSAGICTAATFEANHPIGPSDDARIYPEVSGTATICTPFAPPCDECAGIPQLVVVTSSDGCIKAFDEDFHARQTRAAGGTVVDSAYGSQLVTGALNFGTEINKRISRITVDFTAPVTDTPRELTVKVLCGGSAFDPMNPLAVRTWTLSPRKLAAVIPPGSDSPGTNPLGWSLMTDSRFLAIVFQIDPCTGGNVTLSNFTATIGASPLKTV